MQPGSPSSRIVTAVALLAPAAAQAQDAGDIVVRIGASRTKLVDEGEIRVNGIVDPTAGYEHPRHLSRHPLRVLFPDRRAGRSTRRSRRPRRPTTFPPASLAGTPNLGDDEFVLLTVGGRVQPFDGRISPYVAGGLQVQLTSQERDGLGVNLNIPNAHGPYVEGGVEFNVTRRWGVFASVRKAWYHTEASGLLPLDATFTNFAQVNATADARSRHHPDRPD